LRLGLVARRAAAAETVPLERTRVGVTKSQNAGALKRKKLEKKNLKR
jgi:hypothetical protein